MGFRVLAAQLSRTRWRESRCRPTWPCPSLEVMAAALRSLLTWLRRLQNIRRWHRSMNEVKTLEQIKGKENSWLSTASSCTTRSKQALSTIKSSRTLSRQLPRTTLTAKSRNRLRRANHQRHLMSLDVGP